MVLVVLLVNHVVAKDLELLDLDPTDLAAIIYRLKYGGSHKKQSIARAVGTSNNNMLKVIDATCGFGTDSLVLAYLNCQVFAIEKNQAIANFFSNRIAAAKQNSFLAPIANNIKLLIGDCLELIPTIIEKYDFFPDVIYLDPMFNHKTSAAPNKFIQVLKKILIDYDNKNLLNNILKFKARRVVVKRPRISAHLDNIKPNFIINGKANRFDVYINL